MFASSRGTDSTRDKVRIGATIALSHITQRGTYVCNKTGHLLRVSTQAEPSERCDEAALRPGSTTVTKISDDPRVTRSTAERLATQLDLKIRF